MTKGKGSDGSLIFLFYDVFLAVLLAARAALLYLS